METTNGTFSRKDNYRVYSGATLTVSSTVGNISKIVFTYSQNTLTLKSGENGSISSGTWTGDASSISFDTSGGQVRITKIVVTYTPTAPAYTITAQSNNENYGTVSLSGSVITGSPKSGYRYATPAYTVSPANSATVSQEGNAFTVNPSANTTVTINFEAIPTYTVTFSDGGSVIEASGGAGVTLPSRSALNGYEFAGWSETNVSEETTTAPTIIPAGTYNPTTNITLYPVYTKTVAGGGTTHETASVDISEYATANSWGSSSSYSQKIITINSDVTATCNDGTNSGKYYSDWRIYQTETGKITISTTSGELTSVKFTFTVSNTGTLNYNSSTLTSGTAVDVSGTSAEFTVGNNGSATNGQVRITAIEVKYDVTGGGTTYYWSAPVAATVETPVIVVAENPFLFSTTATITCATEGATIKYSYDNSTWNDYSSALTITETTTISAKAIKDANESSVAQVTATKNLATPTVTVSGDLTLDLNGETDVEAGTLTAAVTYNEEAVEGAVVTWSSSNTDVATINSETGAVTIKTTGSVTFTATYAGNSDYAEATGTKTVTVIDNKAPGSAGNPYTVAEVIAMNPTSTSTAGKTDVYVLGYIAGCVNTSTGAIVTSYVNSNLALVDNPDDTSGNISVQLASGEFRTNYNLVDHPKYARVAQVLIKADVYKYCGVAGLKNIDEMTKVAEAVKISAAEYATWASDTPLDFTGQAKAYTATDEETYVKLHEITSGQVPANTPVVLYKAGGGTINVPVIASADAVGANDLHVSTGTTYSNAYVLAKPAGNPVGFYLWNSSTTLNAGKIYMQGSGSSARSFLGFNFDEETTSIENITPSFSHSEGAQVFYDLQGRKVAKPSRGLYIVNGKKVVIK